MNEYRQARWICPVLVLVVAVLPRILRLRFPEVWFEDAAYLYHAFTLNSGHRPFLDGIYAHPPLLEALLSIFYGWFGTSYRVAELLTASVAAATTLAVYRLLETMTGRWTALLGATAFSLAPLLNRYHVFEREIFTTALAGLAFLLLQDNGQKSKKALLAGAISGAAMTIKLSGAFLLPALLAAYLWMKRPRAALWCLAGWMVVGAGTWSLLLVEYGRPAFLQLIALHFVKGGRAALYAGIQDTFLPNLNYLLLLGPGGLLCALGLGRDAVSVAAAVLTLEIVIFFTFLSGTLWAHNMIDLLLPLSLGTAWGLKEIWSISTSRRTGFLRRGLMAALGSTFVLLGAADPSHLKIGWGYTPRIEVQNAALFIRRSVPPAIPIIAPHYIAAEAERQKLIDYRELYGPYLWMTRTLAAEGFGGLRQHAQFKYWKRMMQETSPLWYPQADKAIRDRRVGAVVWDRAFPEWSFFLRRDFEKEQRDKLLSVSGYRIEYQSGPYLIWLPDEKPGAFP